MSTKKFISVWYSVKCAFFVVLNLSLFLCKRPSNPKCLFWQLLYLRERTQDLNNRSLFARFMSWWIDGSHKETTKRDRWTFSRIAKVDRRTSKIVLRLLPTMQINGLLLQSLVWQSKKVKNLKHLSSSFVTFCPRKTPKVWEGCENLLKYNALLVFTTNIVFF